MPRHPSVTITRKAAERALWAIETALDDIDFGIEGLGRGDPDYPRLERELNAAYKVINRALKTKEEVRP